MVVPCLKILQELGLIDHVIIFILKKKPLFVDKIICQP